MAKPAHISSVNQPDRLTPPFIGQVPFRIIFFSPPEKWISNQRLRKIYFSLNFINVHSERIIGKEKRLTGIFERFPHAICPERILQGCIGFMRPQTYLSSSRRQPTHLHRVIHVQFPFHLMLTSLSGLENQCKYYAISHRAMAQIKLAGCKMPVTISYRGT